MTTNSHDDLAQAKISELQQSLVLLSQLGTRFTAWIGSMDVERLLERSTVAQEHAYALRRAKEGATHLMSPAEEALAAELNVSSGSAWARLHGEIMFSFGNTSHFAKKRDIKGASTYNIL